MEFGADVQKDSSEWPKVLFLTAAMTEKYAEQTNKTKVIEPSKFQAVMM